MAGPKEITINGTTYPVTSWETKQQGQFLDEPWNSFGGSMGETVRRTADGIYFGKHIDTADGTVRLEPSTSFIIEGGNQDIAYCPHHFFDEWDADGDYALYVTYRDTTTTPDIITKTISVQVGLDEPIRTRTSTATTNATAPRIGSPAVFEGATYFPMGDGAGLNTMVKLVTVGDISTAAADTFDDADANTWAYSCAVLQNQGVATFAKFSTNTVRLAAVEPNTATNYGETFEVGDSSDDVTWACSTPEGGVYVSKQSNAYAFDSKGNSYPLFPSHRGHTRKVLRSLDDFDGHMSCMVGSTFFYPRRDGLWRYLPGRGWRVGPDEIDGYRAVPNVSNVPIGLRHYATIAYGQWIYSIYKKPGFANTADVHILSGHYKPDREPEIIWRPFKSFAVDIMGLHIDPGFRLWFINAPMNPGTIPGTAAALFAYINLAGSAESGSGTNFVFATGSGGPGTQLGVNRGAASLTAELYLPEVDFGLPFEQKQLVSIALEIENVGSNVTYQNKVHRDGGSADSIGSTIAANSVTFTDFTPGTTDLCYRVRPRVTIATNGSYNSATSDPRLLKYKIVAKVATIYEAIIPATLKGLQGFSAGPKDTLEDMRHLVNRNRVAIFEPDFNVTFNGEIIGLQEKKVEDGWQLSVLIRRWDVPS